MISTLVYNLEVTILQFILSILLWYVAFYEGVSLCDIKGYTIYFFQMSKASKIIKEQKLGSTAQIQLLTELLKTHRFYFFYYITDIVYAFTLVILLFTPAWPVGLSILVKSKVLSMYVGCNNENPKIAKTMLQILVVDKIFSLILISWAVILIRG